MNVESSDTIAKIKAMLPATQEIQKIAKEEALKKELANPSQFAREYPEYFDFIMSLLKEVKK